MWGGAGNTKKLNKRNVLLEKNIKGHVASWWALPARVPSTGLPPRSLDSWHSEPTSESIPPWMEGGGVLCLRPRQPEQEQTVTTGAEARPCSGCTWVPGTTLHRIFRKTMTGVGEGRAGGIKWDKMRIIENIRKHLDGKKHST